MQKNPAAKQSPAGRAQPDALLEALRQRVPKYLTDVDQGKLIYPACKRTLADADGDVGSVWDHTRLEAMQYVMAVPGQEFGLLNEAARQLEMIGGYLFQRPHGNTVIDFTGTATADFSIAILAGLNWLTHCADMAGEIRLWTDTSLGILTVHGVVFAIFCRLRQRASIQGPPPSFRAVGKPLW